MKFLISVFTLLFTMNATADLVLYTDRPAARMQVIADQFKAKTGTTVQIVELGYGDMLKKLQSEGANSPADVIFVKDLVYLTDLAAKGFFAPMTSQVVKSQVLPAMRDPQNLWTAITYRARTLVYEAGVDVSSINSYEDLAHPNWAGTLCIRTSKSAYNEAFVANMIVTDGYDKAKEIVKGLVANRAQDKFYTSDNQILNAIGMGQDGCLLGITNSYYLGLLLGNPQTANLPIKIKYLNQDKTGVHTNGTGAGISQSTKQQALATQLVEFFLSDDVQIFLTKEHFDFPAKANLVPPTLVKDFGTFKADTTPWTVMGQKVEDARKLMIEVDYL
ncbi:MAG: extracellular solute-binding protein [Bdellovibrionales bacterium]|nr:extracellular solute-binding protein [Bdellovibrionales bacterium]